MPDPFHDDERGFHTMRENLEEMHRENRRDAVEQNLGATSLTKGDVPVYLDTRPSGTTSASPKVPPRQYSVVIARFPGQNQEHPDSTNWVIETIRKMDKDPRISKVGRFTKSDTPITMVRNLAVKTCLDAKIDYLLMIDADMSPDLPLEGARPFWDSAWEFMMERRAKDEHYRWAADRDSDGKPNPFHGPEMKLVRSSAPGKQFAAATIAAPYCGPPPRECVYVFRWKNHQSQTPVRDFRLEMFEREDAAMRSGIQEVAALATGLILYDMRVFKELSPPWFDYEWTDEFRTAKASTEDVFQTRNASLQGLPQFCNWDAWAGHVKPKTVGKPEVTSIDDVSQTLIDAVHKGYRRGERLVQVGDQGIK